MKRKAKASLTVETAMLFPIVFLLLLAVMQCALFLVYETYVKALCDQGVILCQSWYARGETLDTCVEEAKSYLSKQLHSCPWGEPSIYVHGEETIFTRTISLAVEGDYALLFPMRVEAITSGFLERPAAYKETMDLIWEAASLLPPAIPADTGINLRRCMETPSRMPNSSIRSLAARYARFCSLVGR